jgi:hypothetical protein
VTALLLKLQKDFREPLERDFILALLAERLTNLVVLAIDAAQIAKPEKDIAGSATSNESGLFSKVRCVSRNNREQPGIASCDFVIEAIYIAIARAYSTRAQHPHRSLDPLGQLARLKQPQI